MREVFGERGFHNISPAARAIKPTEVGDAARRPNHDKTLVNTKRSRMRGCPRCGDRCGDTLNGSIPIASRHLDGRIVLEESSSPTKGTLKGEPFKGRISC